MASFANHLMSLLLLATSFLLFTSPALGYISPDAAVRRNGTPPRAASLYRTFIVLVQPPPVGEYYTGDGGRRRWYESFLPSKLTVSAEPRLVHSYTEVFNGFAARLTEAELELVSKKPGFVRAFPSQTRSLMTTHTPKFLGLTRGSGLWTDVNYGKGVIVGLLDTGIHAAHPSFNDKDVPPPPPRWKGSCTGSSRCNNKLIGAKSFIRYGGSGPGDDVGHGTHTASTAAGNFVDGASARGLGVGTAAGIAPGAHVAMYKVCTQEGCEDAAIVAGVDAAIKDGVDVLSLSLGASRSPPFDQDPVAISTFSAVSKGITVVCAAGNSGPSPSTVTNDAPWLLTVAAGSVDRRFEADLLLGNSGEQVVHGQALTQEAKSSASKPHPLFYSESEDKRTCGSLSYGDQSPVVGKIAVCQHSGYSADNSAVPDLVSSGAVGVVVINTDNDGYSTILRDYGPDVVQVTVAEGRSIADYVKSASEAGSASILFNNTSLGFRPAPIVASFSSRGPSLITPGVLKPDILAPGLNILAAWPPNDKDAATAGTFKVISGTSMATPHVSGIVALVKSSHPNWSPSAIKSAIITTCDAVDSTGGFILDEQHEKANAYKIGAGHVNPLKAMDPGLVYDLGIADYAGYICALLGDNSLVTIARNSSLTCADLPKIPEAQLNYPTILVQLQSAPFTVNRTVTNVGPAVSTYTLKLDMPESLTVSVTPEKLVFSEAGQKETFSVTVSSHGGNGGHKVVEGSLSWVSGTHAVRSPLVILQ